MFWYRNIVLRFLRFLLTWFIQFLYSLLKTFASYVLTSKSLIWVQILTLGLFWSQNKIFVLIWSIKLYLHFGKQKVLIFVPKYYTALNFSPKGPYEHRKDCSWTQTQCFNVLTQKYRIMVSKVSIDFVYTIPLLFTRKLFPHMFWLQNLSFGSKWLPSACFGP